MSVCVILTPGEECKVYIFGSVCLFGYLDAAQEESRPLPITARSVPSYFLLSAIHISWFTLRCFYNLLDWIAGKYQMMPRKRKKPLNAQRRIFQSPRTDISIS